MQLYYDNESVIQIAYNATQSTEVNTYFINEKIDNGLICTPYVPSQKQLADILEDGLRNISNNYIQNGNRNYQFQLEGAC